MRAVRYIINHPSGLLAVCSPKMNLGIASLPVEPCLIEGILEYPELADKLERAISDRSMASDVFRTRDWYCDDLLVVGVGKILIHNLETCDPRQVKLVMAHFPSLKIGALVDDGVDPNRYDLYEKLRSLATCTRSDITLMRLCATKTHAMLATFPPPLENCGYVKFVAMTVAKM